MSSGRSGLSKKIDQLGRLTRQSLAMVLSVLLVFQPMLANAQSVSAAGSAPLANQPGVGAAPNGVPLIDIVTPNASGLSHNKYDNFNVGTQGLILNNFKGEVGTSSLGGVTPGNPNLNTSNPASVILNEVTSGNRSALNGPTEVFGGRADVIIANPNGITCSGCGFINTPHATLTTGVPNIGGDGSLTGFTVNGGDVTFEGTGGNFAAAPGAVDLFDVVSRQIHINAPIYGKTIRLTGGASKYDYATGEATALTATSGTPEYAIDGTALGAMQADRIKVVVTEKGAGVKMSADMAANAGELSLSADGKISIGTVSGRDGVSITSKQKVTAAKVTSQQKLAVRADQGVTLQTVAADSDIVLASDAGLLSVSGDVNSRTTVQMSSDGGIAVGSVTAGNGVATLVATSGDIAIAGAANSTGNLNLTATAGSISAALLQSSQNIALNAALGIAVAGNVQGQGNVDVTGQSISAGKVIAGINLVATGADPNGNVVLGAAGNLSLTATGGNIATDNLLSAGSLNATATSNVTASSIQSSNDLTVTAASLTSSGITSHGALTVNTAGGGVNVSGQALAASNVLISGSALQAGAIASGVDFAATDANGGSIVLGSSGTLGLTATTGNIVADKLLSAGDLTIQAALLQVNNLISHGNVAITASGNAGIGGGVSVANQLLSAGNTTITSNTGGVGVGLLASGVDFAATKAAGGNIVLASGGDLTINDSAGAIQAGTVLAAGAINAAGQTITADTITGHKDITLSGATSATAASGGVKITGQVLGGGNIGITGLSIAADAIVSGVDIAATDAAGGRITLGPTITGTGNLTLTTAGALSAGTLLSAGDLNASGATIAAGNISAHHDMTLGGVISVSGEILGAGNVATFGPSLSAQAVVAGIDFGATDAGNGKITLGQSGDLTVSVKGAVTSPTIQAAGALNVSGTSVAADSIIGHKNITLSGATTVNNQILGGGNVGISGPSIMAGAVVSGVDFARTAAANGNIALASTGDLTLSASSALDASSLLSAGDLSATGSSVTTNSVTAHGDMTLGGAISVTQQILGSGNVLISGQSLSAQTLVAGIDFNATNAAGGNIVLGQAATIAGNRAGALKVTVNGAVTTPTIQAAGVIDVSGTSITADAITGHKDITVSGATTVTNQVLSGGNVNISGPSIKAGTVVSGVDFAATAASAGGIALTSSGDLTLASTGNINTGTLLSAGNLDVSGAAIAADKITAHHDMTLSGAINVNSQILSSGNVRISGQSLSARTLVAGIDFSATNAASGNIVVGQSGDLKVTAGGAVAASTIQAAGAIDVSGTSLTADSITGHKNITLSGTAAGGVNVANQVLGGGNVGISGSSIKAGAIISGVDFAATAAANGHIVQTASGDMSLTSPGAINAGTLLSAGNLNASGSTVATGSITAHHDMTLGGAINVSGQILGAGNVFISGQSLSAQTVVAGLDFNATDAAGGNIVLGPSGDLTVSVSGAVTAQTIQAADVLNVSGTSVTAGSITGHKNITLSGTAAGVDVTNQVLGGGSVGISGSSIKAGAVISGVDFAATAASGGGIVLANGGDLSLVSSGNINAGTLLSAGGLSAAGIAVDASAVTAHGDMTLAGAISVSGQILGAGNVLISGQSLSAQTLVAGIDFSATNAAGGNIVLGQSGDLKVMASGAVAAPTIQAAGAIDVSGTSLTADSISGHRSITLAGTAAGGVGITSQVLGGGNVSISGPSIKVGAIVSGVDFARTAAGNGDIVLASSGDLTLASPGAVNASTLLSAGSLNTTGSVITVDAVTAHGNIALDGAISVASQILGAGNVLISGQSLSAQTLIAGIDFDATNKANSNIVLGQTGDLTVSVSGAVAAPTIQAGGAIDVSGATINANAVTGHRNMTLSGATTVTNQVLGGGNISISGPGIKVGTVVSGVDFVRTAAANGNIVQAASGDLTLASAGNISVGTLLSAGSVSASGAAVTADAVTAHGNATLKGAITISGQILSAGNVVITGQSLSAQTLVAGIDFDATNAAGGNIVLGQAATVAGNRAGDLTVSVNGAVAAPTVQAAGAIDLSGGSIAAASITGHKDITLSGAAAGGVAITNQLLGGGDVSISGTSIKAGTVVSGVDFAATAAANGNIVQTTSGNLTLASTGNIHAGTLLSAGNLSGAGSIVSADSVTGHGDVTLNGATMVNGQILGSGNVSIMGQSLSAQTIVSGIDFDATNAAGGNIVLGQSGDLKVTVSGGIAASTAQAAGTIDASGATIAANAITARKDITLSGTVVGGVNVANQILGGGNVAISGSGIKAGAIVSGVDFARTAAANGNILLASSGDLTLASSGNIDTGSLLSASALSASGATVNADAVTAHGAVTLNGTTTIGGQVLSAGNVLITGRSLSAQTVVAGIDFAATNASGGNIVLGQTGDLTARLSGGLSASTMEAAGAINVNAAAVTADTVTGHSDTILSGATNVSGQILSGGNVGISGSSIVAGAIVSGVDFAGMAAANGNIVQMASGDVSLTSTGNLTIGTVLTASNLTAKAVDLTASSITSHGKTDLKTSGRVNVSGQVLSAGNLSIDGASLNAGLLISGVDFAATNRSGGNIVLGPSGAMNLAVSGDAAAGTILSASDFTAKADSLQANSITSHGNVGITGNVAATTPSGGASTAPSGRVDVSNQILAAGDLTINGGSISAPTLISGIDFAATNAAGGNIVLAQSGAMNLTATGNIASQTILSAGDITANAADLIAGSITVHGNAGIIGNVDVSNQLIAAGNLTVSGGHINAPVLISGIDFAATDAAGGGIVLGAAATIAGNRAGDMNLTASAGVTTQTMLSAGVIDVSGTTIAVNAITGHGDITLAGSNSVNVTGQLLGAGNVSLSGTTVRLGQAVTGVDFAATARSANGAIVLGPSGDLIINAGSASASALIVTGDLNVAASAFSGGNITGHGAVAIGSSTSPGAVNINGQLLGASNVSVTGSAVSGNVIAAGVDFAATDQSGAGNVILGQAGDLSLTATAGDISFNSLLAAGTITANASNNVSATAVAHGDLTIGAGNAITLSGQSLGTGNVNLNARSITIDTLVSGVDFAATNASSNGSLMLRRAGEMTLAASNGSVSANSLLSGGNLAATATQNISYSSLQSLGNAALTSPGAIAYTSTTRVGGNLTLNTGALDLSGSRGSRLAGGGTLIVNASSANLSGSNLVFGGLTLNLSSNADLSNAQVSTVTNAGGSGDITVSAAGLTTNANTALLAAHDLTLNLPSLGNTGQLAAGNNLTFNIAGDFANTPSGLVFAGNNANLFVGGTLTNNQGALLAGNGLTIAGPGGGGRNGAVVNIAGLLQSGGNMSILTNGLTNTTTSGPSIQRNVQISDDILHAYDLIAQSGSATSLVHQLISQDQLISGAGASAQIRAGGALTINATNLTNAYSSIKSDSNMLLTVAGTLTNDGATLNRITQVTCSSSTPCQYYPDKAVETTTLNCSGPNRPCIENTTTTYVPNPNGTRDPSRDLNPGTTVTGVAAIGAISGVIQARGGLTINGGGAVNNVASNGSIAGQVAIDAAATANNPLGALNSMTAGGALFNVSAALSGVAANGGASASSGPSLAGSGPTISSGPAISSGNLQASGGASVSSGSLTASNGATLSHNGVTAAAGPLINSNSLTAAGNANVSGNGLTAVGGASVSTSGPTAAVGSVINGGGVTAAAGSSISNSGVTAAAGPAINGNTLTAGGALVSPNSLMGKLTAAIGNSGNLTQILQASGAELAAVAKPQSGGVGGTVPGQVFLFETRAAFLDVSKFYGSAYFIDRVGYTPETKVPFLGDAYFDNQLIDEQMRQLVGNGLGAGSFVPGDNATDQMKTLLDNGVDYAAANGLALGQALSPQQAASLTQSMVIYQTEIVDGAPVLVPVVYLSAADRAKTTSAATMSGNTVSIDASSVDNSGAIAAADGMTINAGSIKANGGAFLAGGNMNLNAENGITLAAQTMTIGGQTVVAANGGVTAGGNLKMDAGAGSLTLSGTKVAAGGSAQLSGQTVTLGAVRQDNGGVQTLVGTTVTTGGNLSIGGTNGVNIIASSAKVGGDLSIASSNGTVNIISAGVQNTTVDISRGTTLATTSLTQQASSLTAGGAMLVSGNQGVLIGGSSLVAGGNLGIVSTNGNIAIAASQDLMTSQSKTAAGSYNGYKGGQSSSTAATSNGSSITSQNGNVTVQADTGNISVIGSDIAAKGGAASLVAKGDVTIGEASDSASSSSKFGSKKATETTTTAEGSSISGQTGVNINSTGGDVTISASGVTAGDATHTADAHIQAAGNILIASGKDTKETTSDSKKSGFLSSSKTHTHTYDEDTVGSSVSASGNLNVAAIGETVVSGSNIAAGNNLSLSGSTVTIMGAEEQHESDKQVKKSGIGVGSGGGFISIYGSKDSKSSQSSTDNIGSALSSGGTTTITSTQGDVNIFGSSSHSGDGTVISSARDVNIAPGAEEQSSSNQTKRSGFGINFSSGDGSLSIGIGVAKSEEKRSKDANINAISTLDSDGSITIAANRNINDQSGKILAAGSIGLLAGDNVNMLSSNDVTNASEMQKKSFAGVSLSVQSLLIAAGQQAMQAGSLLSGDNGIYGIAPAVLAGVKGYQAITSTLKAINAEPNPITGHKPAVAGISLTAGYSFSESSSESTTSIPVPPEIRGSSVTIVAKSGDVVGRGVQVSAGMGKDGKTPTASDDPNNGNVLISAAGKVDFESVQATSDSKSSSKVGSVSVGVGASIDASGNIFNAGPTANAAYGSGKQAASSVTQVNSNISGTNTVTVVAGDTLTLAGGVVAGKTVTAGAANGITIESRQDTASYDEKSRSAALGISSGGISGGYNQGTITGDYVNVSQQSGIFAGSGGYHINTNGIIDLKGGFIGSTVDPANNDLTANQILYSNIENSMSASSKSSGFSLIGAGIPIPVVGQPAKQDDHGQTLATVTPGNWNLTSQSQDLSGLNTDASKANKTVDPFDIDKLKAQQQSAAALSQLANMAIGRLANDMHWEEGSPEKVALHAAAAAVIAQLAGGNAGQAAASAAAEELANGILQQVLAANPNLTDVQKVAIGEWAAAFIGAAIGGNGGAAASLDNFNYNYLNDRQAVALRHAVDACAKGNDEACKLQKSLGITDTQSDESVRTACVGGSSTPSCQAALAGLREAYASLVGGRDGLSFEDQAFLDAYMRTELDLLSDPDGSKHLIAGFMLGGGAAAEGAAAAEANVAAQVGKNAAAEESWFGRIWNAWFENPNRSTSAGLGACSSACDSEAGLLGSAGATKNVATPYGPAFQSNSPAALDAINQVQQGATLYRIGTLGQSQAAEAQFWSLQNPLTTPNYPSLYGIPPENVTNANFVETAIIQPGTQFITRAAPAVGTNLGGGIEVVVPSGGVQMQSFSTLGPK